MSVANGQAVPILAYGAGTIVNRNLGFEASAISHVVGTGVLAFDRIPAQATVEKPVSVPGVTIGMVATCSPTSEIGVPRGCYDAAVRALVVQAGFRFAVATGDRLLGEAPDWLALPWVCIGADLTHTVFAAKVSRVSDLYAQLRMRA